MKRFMFAVVFLGAGAIWGMPAQAADDGQNVQTLYTTCKSEIASGSGG
jgi:hypothetical protein